MAYPLTAVDRLPYLREENEEQRAEIKRLQAGLDAAIRAAELALFVIRKQGVMPNSSWEDGFKKDMATAKAARLAGNGDDHEQR